MISDELCGHVVYSQYAYSYVGYDPYELWKTNGILMAGLFQGQNCNTTGIAVISPVSSTQWNGTTYVAGWGEYRERYGDGPYGYGMHISVYQIGVNVATCIANYWMPPLTGCLPPFARDNALVYDMENEHPTFVGIISNQECRAWIPTGSPAEDHMTMNEHSNWSIQRSYKQLLEAFVLTRDNSEQILAYDSTRQLFDIIKIEDGSIWGQTSELPNDFNEMKIIGRYHNDYRRLAVRYDDEIRIYAFGDPIIEAADETPSLPYNYGFAVYPNPFNPSTTISFSLPVYEQSRLSIFNTLGQEVRVLTNELLGPGKYSYTFDASDLPSGIFFAHLSAGSVNSTKKLVLLK
jgi:hypothetical protein